MSNTRCQPLWKKSQHCCLPCLPCKSSPPALLFICVRAKGIERRSCRTRRWYLSNIAAAARAKTAASKDKSMGKRRNSVSDTRTTTTAECREHTSLLPRMSSAAKRPIGLVRPPRSLSCHDRPMGWCVCGGGPLWQGNERGPIITCNR